MILVTFRQCFVALLENSNRSSPHHITSVSVLNPLRSVVSCTLIIVNAQGDNACYRVSSGLINVYNSSL